MQAKTWLLYKQRTTFRRSTQAARELKHIELARIIKDVNRPSYHIVFGWKFGRNEAFMCKFIATNASIVRTVSIKDRLYPI